MTVFTNNPTDLSGTVLNFLHDFRAMSMNKAVNFFEKNIVLDGGIYGESARFHISEEVQKDRVLMRIVLEYADNEAS